MPAARKRQVDASSTYLAHLTILIVFLSIAEVSLIFFGALSPVLSYSQGNLLFALARFAIILYAGIVFAEQGLKKAALNGAMLGFAFSSIICLAALAGKTLFNSPILGISVQNQGSLVVMLILVTLENTLFGAIVAAGAAWASGKLAKKQG